MKVQITHSGFANSVRVSTSSPSAVVVEQTSPVAVELQLFRDGQNGKSAYEIAIENGFVGTEQEWALTLQNISLVDLTLNYNISKL